MGKSDAPFSLVVDDDAMILMDACAILKDAGFRCLEAEDGNKAVAMLDEHGAHVTLLFSDVEMPGGIDGFELARRAAERWPEIEIVIASGRAHPKDDDLSAHATFIAKPFPARLVHDHLRDKLPDGKQPKPLRRQA